MVSFWPLLLEANEERSGNRKVIKLVCTMSCDMRNASKYSCSGKELSIRFELVVD